METVHLNLNWRSLIRISAFLPYVGKPELETSQKWKVSAQVASAARVYWRNPREWCLLSLF